MEVMYVKYVQGKRHSIIKEDKKIIINNSKIIPFDSVQKEKEIEYAPYSQVKEFDSNCNLDDKINDEITNFFFDAIHKNYRLVWRK